MRNLPMTKEPRPMLLRAPSKLLGVALFLAFSLSVSASPVMREAPNSSAQPANQLSVAGNACGPAALLNAFRYGSEGWNKTAESIQGQTDREKMLTIIREVGMRPSKHLTGRARWSRKGVNLADLTDIANELTDGRYLPRLSQEVLFRKSGESQEKLLKRVHHRFEKSLSKGLPPIISLRRYALRKQPNGGAEWISLDAHFVTLISVPKKLPKGERSFPVTYVDPWGGKVQKGSIAISSNGILSADVEGTPCLEANFPNSAVGKKLVRPGEKHALAIAGALGRF